MSDCRTVCAKRWMASSICVTRDITMGMRVCCRCRLQFSSLVLQRLALTVIMSARTLQLATCTSTAEQTFVKSYKHLSYQKTQNSCEGTMLVRRSGARVRIALTNVQGTTLGVCSDGRFVHVLCCSLIHQRVSVNNKWLESGGLQIVVYDKERHVLHQ